MELPNKYRACIRRCTKCGIELYEAKLYTPDQQLVRETTAYSEQGATSQIENMYRIHCRNLIRENSK